MLVWAHFLFYFFCGVLFYGQTKKLQFLLLRLGVGEVNLPAKVEAKIWEGCHRDQEDRYCVPGSKINRMSEKY